MIQDSSKLFQKVGHLCWLIISSPRNLIKECLLQRWSQLWRAVDQTFADKQSCVRGFPELQNEEIALHHISP